MGNKRNTITLHPCWDIWGNNIHYMIFTVRLSDQEQFIHAHVHQSTLIQLNYGTINLQKLLVLASPKQQRTSHEDIFCRLTHTKNAKIIIARVTWRQKSNCEWYNIKITSAYSIQFKKGTLWVTLKPFLMELSKSCSQHFN